MLSCKFKGAGHLHDCSCCCPVCCYSRNSLRATESIDKTGYTTKRRTDIDYTDPETPVYKATLQLIPRKAEPSTTCTSDEDNELDEDDNNNNNIFCTPSSSSRQHFITTITIPR